MARGQQGRVCGLSVALLAVLILGFGTFAQTIVGPDQMNFCETETFTTTITNASVTLSACLLKVTRSYTESGINYVPGSTTITLHDSTELLDDPTSDTWDIDALLGSTYTLPPGESITVEYDLEATCAAVSGTEQVTVDFEDCADPGTPLQNVSSTSIEILPGAIVVSKTPSVQNASVGDLVTWTITVENTGLGRVQNIEITDVLGPGLAYNSSTGGGSNAGQTTTWSSGSLEVGETISVDLTAEVIACAGLYNEVDAAFGCGSADVCFDTAVDEGTATASLNLIVENPDLSFGVPDVILAYCTDETQVQIPIVNNGTGTARNVELCCSIHIYEVDVSRLPSGVSYADGCFSIPDVAPAGTFSLDFYVLHADVDWCAGPPSGTNIFELTYANDCGIPFVSYPQFSTCSSEPGPTLSVSKTGPESLRLGEIGSYDIAVEHVGSTDCGGGIPGPVTIVDTYPEGFTVADPAGGTVDGGARTITWAYDPNTDPPFDETVQLQAPSDCGYCAQPSGGTDPNSITATGTDCCGCPITGEASADTTILCEGFGDDVAYFSSTMELDRTTTVRCSEDYAVTVTHTYTFIDDPALDDFLLNEFVYFVDGGGDLQYLGDSAFVIGATLGTASDGTPAGRLELPLTDVTTVRGKTIVYTYTLIALGLDDPSCQASSHPINAGIDLIGDPTAIGLCGTMYADPDQRLSVTAQPPTMSVAIESIPVIQEYCATYDVTITLTRTSALAKPYDVRLVLTNHGGSILGMSQAVCGGTVSPADGTTCTAPIEGATTYEWRFADLFENDADTTTITFPVTVPCGGPLADLSVVATFDDLCDNDAVYNDECSTSASDEASLSLSANVFTRKSPEILYATDRYVAWSVVLHNTGNGTAYNVWLDDTLGSGLVYDSASSSIDNPTGATEYANLDHNGGALNGVSWVIDEMQPGELRTITVAAELVACTALTNNIAASWGCGGSDCQVPRTDDSSVVVPPANGVTTSFSPTPVSMCSDNLATVTIKNAGVTTVYSVTAVVTLPSGLVYLGNPEMQVNSGAWTPTGEPTVVGQTLTWTQTETPELAEAASKEVIRIRFDYTVLCGFTGGNLSFQAGYENPCGTLKATNVGRFALGLTPAAVTVTLRQVSPAPGEAIDCGGQATWEIDVKNTGSTAIPVVEVDAVLGDGLIYVSSQGDPTYGPADGGVNTLQDVHWELANLPIGATATLQLTGATVGSGLDCEALDIDVNAAWGCGAVDGLSTTFDASCTTTSPATGTISATRRPPLDLTATLSPGSIEACADATELTLTITNTSAVAATSNVDFVITLPDELSYVGGSSEIDCGAGYSGASDPNGAGQTLTWYDVATEGGADDACASIPPGGTIRLRFDVDVSCYFTTQDIPITVTSYDCCGLTQYDSSTSVTLTSLLPQLSVDKSPTDTNLDCYDAGDTVTWTVTVTNNGAGIADWVRLVDTLGSSLVVDSFTDLVDKTPSTVAIGSQVGQTITWEADISLAPGESLSTTVTAHAVKPSDDCSRSLRRNTAVATWGCGTVAAPTCEYGTAAQDQSTVRVPNLVLAPADITPIFDCTGDGITPGSGQIKLVVRNAGTGDAPIGEDFTITVSEPTAGFSVTDTFTALGGTLPLNDDSPQTLTLDGWNVACANCTYAITVTLDTGDTICECQENDNAAVLNGTITLPDLVVDSANLSVACAADGQIRVQGPVTLRNDGCGDPLAGDVSVRFRLFDGANCTGSEIDTFTVDFTGLSIASGGGTEERAIDVTRTLDVCDTCEISIRIETDEDDAVCECDGTNNGLCAGTFPIAFPDLTITDIDFSQVACSSDNIAGVVRTTVENTGCGASGPFVLRLATDGCLTFDDENVADLAAGASTTIDFAVTGSWADCTDCSCTFTATVDPDGNVCECDGTNNDLSEPYTSTLPDLEISGVIGSIGCATDGQATVSADVTVENTGCADVTADFDIAVTLYDGADCTGNIIDSWTETISGETVTASGSAIISLTQRVLSESLCAGDCDYSAHFEVDSGNDICECDGTDNTFCLSSIPSEIPDLVVTEVDPAIDCQAGTAGVTATVGNVGCGDVAGVVFRLTSSGCAPTTDSAPIDLAAGASQDIVFSYTPDCDDWNCTFTVTADPDSAVCECDRDNALSLGPYPGIGLIGDRIWFDTDAEGDQDPGELGIANVTIILEADLDGDGIVDYRAETTTDANGEYLFDDLPAGDYTITVDDTTLPDGMGQTYDYDGLDTPHTSDYTLAENEHNREQDFGYRGLGSIGDYVWFDANADGVQDPTEVGIEGVTLTLVGDLNGDGINEILTTTTDADGLYLFDFLPAGPYTITVDDTTLPAGLSQTFDYDGLGSPHTSDYTLGAGEHNREQDFGYATPALSVNKVIADILRGGASVGNITGPVEPGDVIVYAFTIENVGPVPAYEVGFDDVLPPGIVIETDAPWNAGSYVVSDPSASGSLSLSDGATTFDVPLGLTVNAGETLTATFTGIVTSSASQGDDLTNTAHAYGEAEDGTPIPSANALLGDTSDTDVEDPDADDTGIVTVQVLQPALSVDKTITDIVRPGEGSLGIAGPVEPGDIVFYRFVIRNVGGATAYDVEFTDTLPAGMVTETDAPGDAGTYSVSSPSASGSLGLSDGAVAFTTSIDATIDGGASLTADFAALITSGIVQGVDLVNTAEATGFDGFGTEIADTNASAGDENDDDIEDPDGDDTGIAIIGTEEPALSVDKIITDIVRRGSSIGDSGPVEPGDVIFYEYTIRNVGLGTAYAVDFTDTLPTGLVTETNAPGTAGTWSVNDPPASGTLAILDAVEAFTTAIGATIAGGGHLVADYAVFVTSDIDQGTNLINVAATTGIDGAGNPIPGENADIGDLTDDDPDDLDADDTGITIVTPNEPALSVDKRIVDVFRGGVSVGLVDPILYGDVLVYRVTVRNVGQGTAYGVEFADTLPAGLEIETQSPGNGGGYVVDDPIDAGGLGLTDGVSTFSTSIDAILAGGGTLTAGYTVIVTPAAAPSQDLVNVVVATGLDGAGTPIPAENPATGDTSDDDEEDPDADDTGIAVIRVGLPALVTEKTILNVTRTGRALGPVDTVQAGDIVTYRLRVTNVGDSPAFDVDVRDMLPTPFVYLVDSTVATWPFRIGNYARDPGGAPGPTLIWDTSATLAPDDAIVMRFDALVDGALHAGNTYTNVLQATGRDGADRPIPPNNADAVPDDIDPDDRDEVSLVGGADVPALVTTKRVDVVLRNGSPVADQRIEVGDVVRYELSVRNVGSATAYRVDVSDRLPAEFALAPGSASATWPSGSSFLDPGSFGGDLLWNLDATLRTGDLVVLRFDALVIGPIFDGLAYRNTMQATGQDSSGSPIPTDQRSVVPSDTDLDDASDASLIGRSAFVQGEGGRVIPVPILRKTAEVLGDGACEAWTTTIDRLWFQTDIAMYASSEFELLQDAQGKTALIPETLLPTWLRTVRTEGAAYALDNLLQVNLLSSLGVGAVHAPLTLERAAAQSMSAAQAAADRLAELAMRIGLSPDEIPLAASWIFLEYAGGEPIYAASLLDTGLGPSGPWTVVDRQLVASALGMGLVKQAMEATALLTSEHIVERYLGSVLAEMMADKLLALDDWLTLETSDSMAYVPHAHGFDERTSIYVVDDSSSQLFDQLSLLWGLAEFIRFADSNPAGWGDNLRDRLAAAATRLISETLTNVEQRHVAENGTLLEIADGEDAATTAHLGLLAVALDSVRSVGAANAQIVERLLERAAEQLATRQTVDGRFALGADELAEATWALTAQFAGIRGLLVAHDVADSQAGYLAAAQRAFDALESGLWEDPADCGGVYASFRFQDQRAHCYTPLDVGLAVGALRELANRTDDPERAAFILTRMSRFVRVLVDDAAMQLSNVRPADAQISWATEADGIAGLTTDRFSGPLAPVLLQRLCIEDAESDSACAGWRRSTDEPWYQTDISMYAAFVLQDRLPGIEDIAAANLAAVVFHSGLGVTFAEIPEVDADGVAGLTPVAIPYFSGSPVLTSDSTLNWQPATFDTRVVGSALGMTLLREAQEIRQLLDTAAEDAYAERAVRILTESLLAKFDALMRIRVEGPAGVLYVPHAVRWNGADSEVRWTVIEAQSTLFDQLALLWGLAEAYGLLNDPRIANWVNPSSNPAVEKAPRLRSLIDSVLGTLETAHFDVGERVLVDVATPAGDVWVAGDSVTAATLGLAASALEATFKAFGATATFGERATALLAVEIGFLDEVLWRGTGSYHETWQREEVLDDLCEAQTLAGQLGALRALLAADGVFGNRSTDAADVYRAIDARFWDADLRVYRTALDGAAWCVTPLDLGLAMDALDRAADVLDRQEAKSARERLAEHVNRTLDGVELQLPSARGPDIDDLLDAGGIADAACLHYAPAFDRRVCLQPGVPAGGAAWAEAGDLIRYTVTVENPTDETFRQLLLTDTLPNGVSLVSAEPVGDVSGRIIEWAFDELFPEGARTWRLLARAEESVASGDVLENCAALTYTDVAGNPQPLREACAQTDINSLNGYVSERLRSLSVTYLTDEAMYLASVLESLACQEASDWAGTDTAKDLSLENLGILLTESEVGVPLRFSPLIQKDASRAETLATRLAEFAAISGLPRVPVHGEPIFLPFDAGTPVLERGTGFIESSDLITPASLGWTLVRETQFLEDCTARTDSLSTYLVQLVIYIVESQLEWLLEATDDLVPNAEYLPHAVRASLSVDAVDYGITDPRSSLYDQASLLVGLLGAAQSAALSERNRRLAEQLAGAAFDRLVAHWTNPGAVPLAFLPSEDPEPFASWPDLAVAARALRSAASTLSRVRSQAVQLLDQLGLLANQAGSLDEPIDEAARLLVLVIAAYGTGNAADRAVNLRSWDVLQPRDLGETVDRLVLGSRSPLGWPDTPRQLGILFELLAEVSASDETQRETALETADTLLAQHVLANRVQLRAPNGYWLYHTEVACFDLAPVFVVHRGRADNLEFFDYR